MKDSRFKFFAVSSLILAVVSVIICIVMAINIFAVPLFQKGDAPNTGNVDSTDVPKYEFSENNLSDNTDKGNENTGSTSQTPGIKFANVGEKYQEAVKPLYDAAQFIFDDLIENGKVSLINAYNPKIIGLCYAESLWITIHHDVKVYSDVTSEFLQQEYSISLNDFINQGTTYSAYKSLLVKEKSSQLSSNYVNLVKPLAQKCAELMLEEYGNYKHHPDIKLINHGKQIILRADSSLPVTYGKIADNLNVALARRNYPLICNQYINISFGGNIGWNIVYRWIIIEVSVNNLTYMFYLSFNENGEFSKDCLNYFMGTARTGYTPVDPDQFNPKNEDYADFFVALKIEEMDLKNLAYSYGYEGEGKALYSPEEYTYLYF